MDEIRTKFGKNSILRGISYTHSATAKHRNTLIGGHRYMPKGRGMVKWSPFAAMPEQFAGICDMNHKFAGTASLWFFLFTANLCFR